jgi:hypothetical protein
MGLLYEGILIALGVLKCKECGRYVEINSGVRYAAYTFAVTEIGGDLHLNSRFVKQEVTKDGKHGDRYYNCKMRIEFIYRFFGVRRFGLTCLL